MSQTVVIPQPQVIDFGKVKVVSTELSITQNRCTLKFLGSCRLKDVAVQVDDGTSFVFPELLVEHIVLVGTVLPVLDEDGTVRCFRVIPAEADTPAVVQAAPTG